GERRHARTSEFRQLVLRRRGGRTCRDANGSGQELFPATTGNRGRSSSDQSHAAASIVAPAAEGYRNGTQTGPWTAHSPHSDSRLLHRLPGTGADRFTGTCRTCLSTGKPLHGSTRGDS